jgi:putative membrane protein
MLAPGRLPLVLALMLVPLAGCEQRSYEPGSSAMGGPATHTSPSDEVQPAPIAVADREFLIEATETGLAEAEASHLVAERGADLAVRSFAERLLAHHAQTNDELGHLAALKGLTLPAEPGAEKGALVGALRGLGGAALDRAFLQRLVASRPAAIALYEREAKGSEDPELRAFAAKTLPLLREHQALTRQLAVERRES